MSNPRYEANKLHFMYLASQVSKVSKDPSTQVGAVIVRRDSFYTQGLVLTSECNRIPDGLKFRKERYAHPEKYSWCEHAERNAIFKCARLGLSTHSCDLFMFCTTAMPPCCDCARAIIQSGISNVFVPSHTLIEGDWRAEWKDSFKRSIAMFEEAGVGLIACEVGEE